MHGVHNELDADEGQHDRQSDGKVDQPAQQPTDEEVQLTQAHEGEDVGGEHEVGLLGEAVDGRDGIQRKEQVGGAQRDDDEQHRGDEPLAVLDDRQLGALVLLGGGDPLANLADQEVVLGVLVVVALEVLQGQLDGGVDKKGAEDEEDPAELLDRGLADGDKRTAEDQRQDDAHQQSELLELAGHLQLRHDDDEDEQVVDREAVLGDPTCKEFAGVLRPRKHPDAEPEKNREADEDADEDAALFGGRLVRAAPQNEDVDEQHRCHHSNGDDPGVKMNVHAAFRAVRSRATRGCLRRRRGVRRPRSGILPYAPNYLTDDPAGRTGGV